MTILDIVLISFVLEILEALLQYANSLKEAIYKLYLYYKKTPILFFLTNLDYIWMLYLSVSFNNLSWPIIVAISLKTFDIVTKLDMIKKVFIKPDIKYIAEIEPILDSKISFWLYMVGPLTYPYLIYLSFN